MFSLRISAECQAAKKVAHKTVCHEEDRILGGSYGAVDGITQNKPTHIVLETQKDEIRLTFYVITAQQPTSWRRKKTTATYTSHSGFSL